MKNELSRVVDALPGLVWTALADGRIDFLNQRWCEYTGLSVDEARVRGWEAAIHPDDLPALIERWGSIVASGEPGEMEARLRRFDGVYRWFLFGARPLAGASGEVVQWCGMSTDIDDRRRVEHALRAREDHYRSIADSIPALIAFMTPAGEVESVNRHVLDYLGTTLEELRGWTTADSVHPDDLPAVIVAWKRSVDTGEPYEIEHRMRRADGVYRWFGVRALPLRDIEGRVARWYVLQTDIDDRKRAEALLAGEKRLLEMVALGRPLPVVLEALCKLLDTTAEGCSSSVLLVDRARTKVRQVVAPGLPSTYNEVFEGRTFSCAEAPCGMAAILKTQVIVSDVTSDSRWESTGWPSLALAHGLKACWSSPILSLSCELLGTFAIYRREVGSPTRVHQALIQQFTHIASIAIERTRSEESLKRGEAFLAEAELLSATGSFSLNPVTEERWWSEQTYRIFGVDPGQPPTFEVMRERVHPDDREVLNHGLECARRGEGLSTEFRLQMPDGTIKHLQVVGHAAGVSTGEPVEFVGAVRDITERRLSEETLGKVRSELAHVARVMSLGALTASIAHEVNQPLSGIITNASTCLRMLAAEPPNVEGARETARRTIRDGHRASDVITRLRALFRKEAATSESVDLNEAAGEVIALVRSELQRSRVLLRAETAEDLPPVLGDRVQLQQVILNLLLNASDAMREVADRPRQMVVKTERDEGDHVCLSVRDAGVGLEPQGLDRLFEAFYTTKSNGMGIGLSVSRSIIESHHGRLWAAPNEGPGATFAFSIPTRPERAAGVHSRDAIRTDLEHVRSVPPRSRILGNP